MFVPGREELVDRLLQVGHAAEGIAADALAGQLAEPSLNQIQPTRTGGHEMANEARMAFQPSPDVGMLVRAVVVHDQMQRDLSGELLVQPPEKAQELLVPMPLMALSDHRPLKTSRAANKVVVPLRL